MTERTQRILAGASLLLVLLLGVWFSRSGHDAPIASPPTPSGRADRAEAFPLPSESWSPTAPGSPLVPLEEGRLREDRDPPAANPSSAPVAATPRAAIDLPEVDPDSKPARDPPTIVEPSTCGGLYVRLITNAEDQKWAVASMASAFDAPAQMRRVGETIAGFRVTKIEWDRVWVASGARSCAVGMHFGVRQADSELATALSGEDYAKLPWVLSQEVVAGLSKRAEMEFSLTTPTILALYAKGVDVFAGLRLEALGKPGEGRGLKLFDVRLDSLLERLGIEEGDVLLSMNEAPLSTALDVTTALQEARQSEELRAGFQRGGEPFVLEVSRSDGEGRRP